MDTNCELRDLTVEELDAVTGAKIDLEIGPVTVCDDNAWDKWIWDYFRICV